MTGRISGKWRVHAVWTGAIALAALTVCGFVAICVAAGDEVPNTGMADPAALVRAYDRFVAGGAPSQVVTLSLSNLRGISSEAMNAGGQASVDLTTGAVESTVQLLPTDRTFDLWLIDNRPGPGRSTLADPGDALMRIGTYTPGPAGHTLAVSAGADLFTSFFPDRAFVVRSDTSPIDGFVLTGPSTLFARLQHRQVRFVDQATASRGFDPADPAARMAHATRAIAQGRRLFLKDTFDGNGRTCGTCHVEANNFTVDPALIATLPSSDPLFVAETNPALATLERSDLLRQFGLILVNADGLDSSRGFVFRSTQNVQALANSSVPQDPALGVDFSTAGLNPNPPERLGWGNDAPPLRDFALVAIAQHAPSSMNRIPGVDFRVPTDEELDVLAAYQLALGRQEDFELPTLTLTSAQASRGKTLFLDSGNLLEPGHKNCNSCHFNGGGTTAMTFIPSDPGFPRVDGSPRGFNIASPTSVNDIPRALALGLPRDGGFGQIPTQFGSFGNTADVPGFPHFELEEFNSPPVVESADTGPFFHNHTVPDLESAVAFYGSPEFKASVAALAVPIDISADASDPDVQAIAAFLRVLNALENIRSSIDVAARARSMAGAADRRELAGLSRAEVVDALQVLSEGSLATSEDPAIVAARGRLQAAKAALDSARHLQQPTAIENLLTTALRHLRSARSALADPATLPASFMN